MQLTKEQAIQEHRKMWNWIADQYEQGSENHVSELKDTYLKLNDFYGIAMNCFCCEYDNQNEGSCIDCPLTWSNGLCFNDGSEYDRITSILNFKERAIIAKQIANLPEWS